MCAAGPTSFASFAPGFRPIGTRACSPLDGAVTREVPRQLARLPKDSTHLVVSAGGNDALGASFLLGQPVATVAEALSLLETAQHRFAADYREMADAVAAAGLPAAFCTVYDTPPSVARPAHRPDRARTCSTTSSPAPPSRAAPA